MQRRQHPGASGTGDEGGAAAAAAATAGGGIERTVGGGSASGPDCSSSSSPSSPPPNSQGLAPELSQPPRAPGGTGAGLTAPCWVESQPPWIATTRWWRKPWKVRQAFPRDPGVGIGAWGGKRQKEWRSATRVGPSRRPPRSLSGWRVTRLRRGLHCLRRAAGRAPGHWRGMGPRGVRGPGKAGPLHPAGPRQHPPWELRRCPEPWP